MPSRRYHATSEISNLLARKIYRGLSVPEVGGEGPPSALRGRRCRVVSKTVDRHLSEPQHDAERLGLSEENLPRIAFSMPTEEIRVSVPTVGQSEDV